VKRPSFQFYPADWQANSNLRRCSFEEKGLWLEVICLLHDQETYGVAHWTLRELAQAIGCAPAKLKGLVEKGILKGADSGQVCGAMVYTPRTGRKLGAPVVLVDEQPGPVWYSSRMVIDEHKRIARGDTGEAPKHAPKPPIGEGIGDTPKPAPDPSPFSCTQASRAAPSSSSSSSSSKVKQTKAPAESSFDPISQLESRGVNRQTALDWMKLRKAKRLPLTTTALQGVEREAGKAGLTLEQALLISCRRGWAGFENSWLTDADLVVGVAPKKDWE